MSEDNLLVHVLMLSSWCALRYYGAFCMVSFSTVVGIVRAGALLAVHDNLYTEKDMNIIAFLWV